LLLWSAKENHEMMQRFDYLARLSLVTLSLWLCACKVDDGGEATTSATGNIAYKDAEPPAAQPIQLDIHVAGSGTLSGLQTPECTADGATGDFSGLFTGSGEIRDDGTYVGAFSENQASFETPTAHCEIPDLSIDSLTEVVIVAKLQNTTQNCQSYCQAKASAAAESQCGTSAEAASCRADAEASYAASCQTQCTGSTTRRITAELVINATSNATLLADLNARQLGASGMGQIQGDLTFEYIREDGGDGDIVSESP
jgi:hypothetical protein